MISLTAPTPRGADRTVPAPRPTGRRLSERIGIVGTPRQVRTKRSRFGVPCRRSAEVAQRWHTGASDARRACIGLRSLCRWQPFMRVSGVAGDTGPMASTGSVRRAARLGRRRRRRRLVGLMVLLALLAPVIYSYTTTMMQPSSLPLWPRSVEWLRAAPRQLARRRGRALLLQLEGARARAGRSSRACRGWASRLRAGDGAAGDRQIGRRSCRRRSGRRSRSRCPARGCGEAPARSSEDGRRCW